jgi:hypothetical protein
MNTQRQENIMHRSLRALLLPAMLLAVAGMPSQAGTGGFQPPVLITSAGQSADVTLAGSICKKAKIDARVVASATAAELKGVKTLIVVPGFSSKGLGAAGTSREQEMERVKAILKAAADAKIPVLMMHIGGKARRGVQSDDFNRLAAEAAHHMIVVKQGEEDGFFAAIAAQKKVPLEVVDRIAGVVSPLGVAFK